MIVDAFGAALGLSGLLALARSLEYAVIAAEQTARDIRAAINGAFRDEGATA